MCGRGTYISHEGEHLYFKQKQRVIKMNTKLKVMYVLNEKGVRKIRRIVKKENGRLLHEKTMAGLYANAAKAANWQTAKFGEFRAIFGLSASLTKSGDIEPFELKEECFDKKIEVVVS